MAEEIARVLAKGDLIIRAPKRAIVRESNRRMPRYKVYLPSTWNDLWEQLRRMGKDVDIIVVIRF